MSSPLEQYLRELRDIRSSGAAVKETSYYPALSNLFNEIGKTLKPKVRCIISLKDMGAGLPDGGFFTPDQFQRASDAEPLPGQIPARGVIEAKPTGDETWLVVESKQVSKYWDKYRQVLVTNYRDFLLLGQDSEGKPVKLEAYRLAESESAFWEAAATPRTMAKMHGERFIEYLKRVMLHAAPLASPQDVAWFLSSYARDAKARIEGIDLPSLKAIREALEEALGLKFEGTKGDQFFPVPNNVLSTSRSLKHHKSNGRSLPNACAIVLGRENARVRFTFRGPFASLPAVTVHVVEPALVELGGEALSHDDK